MAIGRKLPTTKKGIRLMQNKAKAKNDSIIIIADRLLSLDTQNRLDISQPLYKASMLNEIVTLGQETSSTSTANKALDIAKRLEKDFAGGIIKKMKRDKTLDLLPLYGISMSTPKVPTISNQNQVTTIRENYDAGETARGGVAMANPTIGDVDTAVNDYETKKAIQSTKLEAHGTALANTNSLGTETKKVNKRIADELKTQTDDLTNESARVIMRLYGVPFMSDVLKTFNLNITNGVTHAAVVDALIELVETGKTTTSSALGAGVMKSRITDGADFSVTHPLYHDGDVTITVYETVTDYTVNIVLIPL